MDWKTLAEHETGASADTLVWHTPEGIAVKPLYTAGDLAGITHLDSLPGFEPFVRGPRATMYAGRPWTIRQYAGFSTAEATQFFGRPRCFSADRLDLAPRPVTWAQKAFIDRFTAIESQLKG